MSPPQGPRWATQIDPYSGGEFLDLYKAGVTLLQEVNREWDEADARATKLGRIASSLSAITTGLAAGAACTALPGGVSHWVTGAAAAAATFTSGGQLRPAAEARKSALLAVRLRTYRREIERYLRTINATPADTSRDELETLLADLEANRPSPAAGTDGEAT